jgi:hypothetical protein
MAGIVDSQQKIIALCDSMKALLLEKNQRYGDSALSPLGIFSTLNATEGIKVRLDDKLARIKNHPESLRKNDIADTIGYLILLCAAQGWTDFSDLVD